MHNATRSKNPVLIPPLGEPQQSRGTIPRTTETLTIDNQSKHTGNVVTTLNNFVEVELDNSELILNSIAFFPSKSQESFDTPSPNLLRSYGPFLAMSSGAPTQGGGVPPGIPMNPLVQPRGLPILVPPGLAIATIPPNLPLFRGTRDEDPSAHVERFIELLTTCLITDNRYFLVWFPTTLKDGAYEWYRNHPANTFVDWDMLQRAFLEEFRPEVGQSAALTALSSFRQGRDEDITSYIRRFELVVTRFVGTLLTDDTLKNFFIQGFSKECTIREILNSRPRNLADAKNAARVIEQVNKEHDRIWRKEDQSIPSFIPIHAQSGGPPLNSSLEPISMTPQVVQRYPTPLDSRLPTPIPVLAHPDGSWKEEMKREMQLVQQGFQNQIAQQMKLMTDQMAALARAQNPNPLPPPIESGNHSSGLWCAGCSQPGHTIQFCNAMPLQNQQNHGQQPYTPSNGAQSVQGFNHGQQGYQSGNQGPSGQFRPRAEFHAFCGNYHLPGQCWLENQVVCGNCGGNHPTDRCKKPDRIFPLQPPPGNYVQQGYNNRRGERRPTTNNTLRPPNLYYDYDNNRQNQHPPIALQTTKGLLPLNQNQNHNQNQNRGPFLQNQQNIGQGSQDVRLINQTDIGMIGGQAASSSVVIQPIPPESNLIMHKLVQSEMQKPPLKPALAIMTRSRAANLPPPLEGEESTTESPPHFSELENVAKQTRHAINTKGKEPLEFEPLAEDLPFQTGDHDEQPRANSNWEGPMIPNSELIQLPKAKQPILGSYDLWADFGRIKADITIAQLLEISPAARRMLKSGTPTKRRRKPKVKVAARVQTNKKPMDVKAVEIEVSIVDKIIPNVLVDGGSSLNIMPLHTMEKLGLELTGPSPFVINMANQRPEAPLGVIKNCKVTTGGEEYFLTFHVIQMYSNKGSFPLLLGRPWLTAASAKVDWGGNKPHIVYGPSDNLTKVRIQPSRMDHNSESLHSSDDEMPIPLTKQKTKKQVRFETPESSSKANRIDVNRRALGCMGPGFYDWQDDGQFAQWLVNHPYSDVESSSYYIEASLSRNMDEGYPDLATLVDDITYDDVCQITIDGTQIGELEILVEEDDLLPPLHVRRTTRGLEVGTDLPIYPPVPNDWYRGPTKLEYAKPTDWKTIDVSFEEEDPKPIKIGSQLTDEEAEMYRALVMEYRDIFAWSYKDLKGIPPGVAQHTIPLIPGAKPVRQKERRMNPNLQLIVKAELERLLQVGFIKPVEITDWVSPMVLVKKKNGKLRVCIDYRTLNKFTQKDHFPLPFVNTILDEVAGHELYTFMDGYSGYNQISIAPEDHHKTAFTTPWGTFIYLVMPFGLCNAPSAFQRAMTYAFSDLLHKSMTVFIDDFSTQTSGDEHLAAVRESFKRCRQVGISLNPEKLYLAVIRGVLLGYIVSAKGKEPDPEKVDVIVNLKPPTDIKSMQRTLGHMGWYRDLIQDYASISAPLTNLIKKASKYEWTSECQLAFDALKKHLSTYPIVRAPDWNLPFHVYCDASAVAVGSTLCQPTGSDGKDLPVAFASKQLSPAEKNYTTTERECLAMVFSVKKYRHYLLLNPVIFFVDHMAIKYLVNKPELSGRLARWVLLLEEFDYTVEYKPGKMHKQADHLSRLSTELDDEPINDEIPVENLFTISSSPLWYNHISEFLATQQLPTDLSKEERRKVRVNSRHFALLGGRLYRRGIDGILRRCVDASEIPAILAACHDSACGGHFSGQLTGQKILRAGYYWPTLFRDAHAHVKKCDACQRYARNDLHMALPLNPILPLAPFEKWGIDFIGEIHPSSSNGMRHIIVATEYLTKWAEAKAIKTNDASSAANFLFEYIIARFGCPKVLISDRGRHFLNEVIEGLTQRFQIDHRKTTPYHPQTNGHTERVNQTLVNILRKTVVDSKKDWNKKLVAALWAYRTTFKVTTRATPFSLVYGIEPILPIEFEVPSLRIAIDNRMTNSQSLRDRLDQLEGLDEARMISTQHLEAIQRRRKIAFDKCNKTRILQPGMLILLQDARRLNFPSKFDALWLGPYIVREVFANNSVQLETLNGELFPTRTAGSRCKEYKT
jgi:hypothetical protein